MENPATFHLDLVAGPALAHLVHLGCRRIITMSLEIDLADSLHIAKDLINFFQ
jgi:copper homeostasis protein CutC